MLRIVDMREAEDDGNSFSVYNTVTSRFYGIEGFQCWHGEADFREQCDSFGVDEDLENRICRLLPDWAKG